MTTVFTQKAVFLKESENCFENNLRYRQAFAKTVYKNEIVYSRGRFYTVICDKSCLKN